MDMNSVRLKVKGYFDTKARISLKYFKVSHKSLQNKLGRFFVMQHSKNTHKIFHHFAETIYNYNLWQLTQCYFQFAKTYIFKGK